MFTFFFSRKITTINIFSISHFFFERILHLEKISNFDRDFKFWPKFQILTNILIFAINFDKNFEFRQKFRILTKISNFDKNFEFWQKFRILTKISDFDKYLDFRKIFNYFRTFILSIRNFPFFQNFRFLRNIFLFFANFLFFARIFSPKIKNLYLTPKMIHQIDKSDKLENFRICWLRILHCKKKIFDNFFYSNLLNVMFLDEEIFDDVKLDFDFRKWTRNSKDFFKFLKHVQNASISRLVKNYRNIQI